MRTRSALLDQVGTIRCRLIIVSRQKDWRGNCAKLHAMPVHSGWRSRVGLNFNLPSDFPSDQLIDITRSLEQLPDGTAEGCRAALEYARNRLPAIRREHIVSEEVELSAVNTDNAPPVLRNSRIDEQLRHLIASTTTALDEYRLLAATLPPDEPRAEAQIAVSGETTKSAVCAVSKA